MSEHPDETVRPLVESLELSGVLDAVAAENDARLTKDAEWSTPKYYHVHTLVRAFSDGVLSADPWHHGYRLPPDFEGVVNWIAFNIQKRWPGDAVPQVSLLEMRELFGEWAREHPSFLKWNESADGNFIGIVSRYSDMPDHRDFIDLDALLHNAVLFLRDHTRKSEAFDREFEAKPSEPVETVVNRIVALREENDLLRVDVDTTQALLNSLRAEVERLRGDVLNASLAAGNIGAILEPGTDWDGTVPLNKAWQRILVLLRTRIATLEGEMKNKARTAAINGATVLCTNGWKTPEHSSWMHWLDKHYPTTPTTGGEENG